MVERLIELGLMALAQTKTHSAGAFAGNDFMGITIHQQDQVIPSDENSMRVTKYALAKGIDQNTFWAKNQHGRIGSLKDVHTTGGVHRDLA
jgi:hypothetical protein